MHVSPRLRAERARARPLRRPWSPLPVASGGMPSAACVPQRQKWPNHERPPEASRWPHGTESSLSGPAMGSSKRMPSAVGASAKVRAHAARTDRPFQERPAKRSERSAAHRMCVRSGARAAAHHERVEHARLDLGRAQLLRVRSRCRPSAPPPRRSFCGPVSMSRNEVGGGEEKFAPTPIWLIVNGDRAAREERAAEWREKVREQRFPQRDAPMWENSGIVCT